MANQQQQQMAQMLTAWTQAVDASHAQLMQQSAPAPPPTPEPTFIQSVVGEAASLGQAALDNPEIVAAMAGGAILGVGGLALATGGGVVSTSGVGAVAGVPAAYAGGGLAVAGFGGAALAFGQLVAAADQNPVGPMQVNGIFGRSKEEKIQDDLDDQAEHARRGREARDEQMENLNKTPDDIPPLFRWQK